MVNDKHPNEAKESAPTNQKPRDLDKPSPKSNSSNKATHGSLTSNSASSGWGGNRDASSGNAHHEAWALQKWLEQVPRDEPWRPGSRKA